MARPRRKRDKERGKKPMKAGKLRVIERLKRMTRAGKAGAGATASGPAPAQASAEQGARRLEPPPARPAPSARVSQMRELGLSVSVDATAEQLDRLQERFDLVCQYVRDVCAELNKDAHVEEIEAKKFVAHLLDDGRLADAMMARQKTRQLTGGPPAHDSDYRIVVRALRQFFPQQFDKPSLFKRLLGRS